MTERIVPAETAGDMTGDTTISEILEMNPELEGIGQYQYGWSDKNDAGASARRGINEEVVRDISAKKSEPDWMTQLRVKLDRRISDLEQGMRG